MRRVPERKRRTERLELEKMKRRAFEGKGYEEYPKYPYFSPDYELPFTHILSLIHILHLSITMGRRWWTDAR